MRFKLQDRCTLKDKIEHILCDNNELTCVAACTVLHIETELSVFFIPECHSCQDEVFVVHMLRAFLHDYISYATALLKEDS